MLYFSDYFMKRTLLVTIALLFLIPFIFAQTPDQIDNINSIPKNISANNFKAATNVALDKQIDLPDWTQVIARILFGVEDKITLSKFIILLAVWIMLFLMILNIVKIMPFFKEGPIKVIASITITIIIAITKVMITLSNALLSFASSLKFFQDWSAGALFFSIFVVLVVFFIIIKISNKISTKMQIGEAEGAGLEAGKGLSIMRVVSKVFNKK